VLIVCFFEGQLIGASANNHRSFGGLLVWVITVGSIRIGVKFVINDTSKGGIAFGPF
jgi:hypothetical protein